MTLEQQERHGLSDEHAPADDDGTRPGERDAGRVEEPEDAERCTRTEPRETGEQPALIHRVQPIHVLFGRQCLDHHLRAERRGQR